MILMTSDGETVALHLKIPAWVKALIAEAAEEEGMSMSQYCAHVLSMRARDTIGIPNPPPAAAPIPSISDVLRSYVDGSKLIGPCGKPWPCEYSEDSSKFIGDVEFCGECNIRVH
jgi:hypothetical protein